jgi:hypothetical protein
MVAGGGQRVFGRDDELAAVAEFVRQAAASPAVLVIVDEAGTDVPFRDAVAGSSGGLFFGLLCPLAVWRDGEPLELGTPQQRRVVALLLLRMGSPRRTSGYRASPFAEGLSRRIRLG